MWENPVTAKMRRGEAVVGATLTTPSLDIAARLASAGFDFLWVDMEHSPITLESFRHIILATRGLAGVPLARIPTAEMWVAKRVLDAGAYGVVFPFVSTRELAERAVASCRYPPAGQRGSGAGLATSTWPEPDTYCDSADRNILVVAMIEEIDAVRRADEIASTPGLDVLFVGTGDLSFSLGLRGDMEHAKVDEAVEEVAKAARRHNVFVGRPAANAEQIKRFVDRGYLFFQTASDLNLLESAARQLLAPLRGT